MDRAAFGITDTGLVRANNEDAFLVCNEKVGPLDNLLIVADGMGGHKAGEVASAKAVTFFFENVRAGFDSGVTDIAAVLVDALDKANGKVLRMSETSKDLRGMGTTLTACGAAGGVLHYIHVGDSRLYAMKSTGIRQITTDHTLMREMLDAGRITEAQAKIHPDRNVITRAVGTNSGVRAETGEYTLQTGDTILLCSDGLTGMIDDVEIFTILFDPATPDLPGKAGRLIEAAKARGGIDNITVVLW